jgi:hypothetical protein
MAVQTSTVPKSSISACLRIAIRKRQEALFDPGWLGRELASGWQVSGSVTAEKGLPLQITAADTSNTGGMHTQVADRVCDGRLSSPMLTTWFNTACFVQPAAGRLGNSGRNILVGPGLTNFDISALKRFLSASRAGYSSGPISSARSITRHFPPVRLRELRIRRMVA